MEQSNQIEKGIQTSTQYLHRKLYFKNLDVSTQTDPRSLLDPRARHQQPQISPSVLRLGLQDVLKRKTNKPSPPKQIAYKSSRLIQIFGVCKSSKQWSKLIELQTQLNHVLGQLQQKIELEGLPILLSRAKMASYISNYYQAQPSPALPGKEQSETVAYLKNYVFSNKLIKKDQFKKSKRISIKRYKNCIFFGQVIDGLKEGAGLLLFQDGKRYEGSFQKDLKQGFGVQIATDGIYVGQWKNGSKDGFGVSFNQKQFFAGFYSKNQKHGPGIYSNLQISTLNQYNNGSVQGLCVQTTISSKQIYVGTKINTDKLGIGMQRFLNNDVYFGNYQIQPQGYGEYYWENGAIYKGDFLNGLRHGKGEWRKPGGDFYEGQYKNDKKCGKGLYVWENGLSYRGEFYNDLRHGEGVMVQGGNQRKGSWTNGIQDKKKKKAK